MMKKYNKMKALLIIFFLTLRGQFLYRTQVKSVNFVLKYVTETGSCGRFLKHTQVKSLLFT